MQRNACVRNFSTTALVVLLLAFVLPASAREQASATPATGTSATARVAFRVVVLERLDATSGLRLPANRRITPQRQSASIDGRQVLTIASP